MNYIDGFVAPVPKKKLGLYKSMANKMSRVFRKYGALAYVEAAADDVKKGKWTSFPQSVKLKAGETVVFAYIVHRSRAARDLTWKKVMKDPIVQKMCDPSKMPFDGRRMFWGGFKAIVQR